MEELYSLKEMLCKELENYGRKGEMSAGTLEIVDKLAHAIKNLDKIIEAYDEEYSGAYYGESYEGGQGGGGMSGRRGSSRRGSSRGGSYRSYARGRNARRDSMGRYSREGYSRHGDMIEELRELMEDAPDEQTRMEIQKLVEKMEMR